MNYLHLNDMFVWLINNKLTMKILLLSIIHLVIIDKCILTNAYWYTAYNYNSSHSDYINTSTSPIKKRKSTKVTSKSCEYLQNSDLVKKKIEFYLWLFLVTSKHLKSQFFPLYRGKKKVCSWVCSQANEISSCSISELLAVWEHPVMAQHVKPCQVLQFPSCFRGKKYHPDELN